jgi:hypothetical protein
MNTNYKVSYTNYSNLYLAKNDKKDNKTPDYGYDDLGYPKNNNSSSSSFPDYYYDEYGGGGNYYEYSGPDGSYSYDLYH